MLRIIRQVAINLEEFITGLFLVAIVILVFIAAVSRYVGYPINWSVDIAQALFVWVIFLGANQALRSSRHIGVSLLVDRLSPFLRTIIQLLVYLLICAFLVVIIWNGIHISIINWRRILHNIPVSYSFVTMAAPVGALLMLLTTGSKIVFAAQLLYQLGKGQDKSKAEQNKSESTII